MKKQFFLLFFLGFFGLAALFPAFAKDYSIKSADFNVQLNSDGSVLVEEKRIYDFDGSFSWADEWIELSTKSIPKESRKAGEVRSTKLPNYRITDFSLSEGDQQYQLSDSQLPGTYETSLSPDKFYVKWHYQAQDEQKTFTLRYKIENAIVAQTDIAEFYWQLIGDQWTKGTGVVSTSVNLPFPAPNDQIWAFGHGPLNGKVSIPTNQQVDFSATGLPANKFFEVRVLFPKTGLTTLTVGESNLEQILAEEKGFGQQTENQKNLFRFLGFGLWLIYLLFAGTGLWITLKAKRAFKPIKEKLVAEAGLLSGKLHEPPSDLPPAEVEALLKKNLAITGNSFLATILDLVRRRILKINRSDQKTGLIKKDYRYWLENTTGKSSNLGDYEGSLYDYLNRQVNRNKDQKIEFEEIKNYGLSNPLAPRLFFMSFQNQVKDSLKGRSLLDSENQNWQVIPHLLAVRIFLVLNLLSIFGLFWLMAPLVSLFLVSAALGWGGLMIITGPLIFIGQIYQIINYWKNFDFIGYSYEGYKQKLQWLAFKKYLKEYSVTDDDPVDSIVIWEKMLVYGVVLGVSVKALASLPVKFSADDLRLFTAYYAGFSTASFGSSDFSASFSNLAATLQSLSTSSYGAHGVGGGGGFSGGGGGGGGGGGAG